MAVRQYNTGFIYCRIARTTLSLPFLRINRSPAPGQGGYLLIAAILLDIIHIEFS